ncbi:hypothetical protein [Methanoculleus sp.]|uniref:hypothetical protein n=2 Tax=Methanoculleus sp. TaxID=90427 RepID=UPI0025DE16E0|nr:hypothetical protein [Methanoculleus sp.]
MMGILREIWQFKTVTAVLLIAVLLSMGMASAAEAAPTVAWNTTFSPENNSKFDAVAPTADGGYIALGSAVTKPYGGRQDLLLMKTDGQGNEVWTERFPEMIPASVAETSDGGYIAGAYNLSTTVGEERFIYQGTSFLIRTDAAGKEEWRQVLPNEKVSAVRPTADGGYVIIGWLWNPPGSANDTTAVITKTDSDGTPTWNRTFPGTSANAGVVTADGGYIIGGTSSPFNNDVGDAFLIRLDADGNTVWHKNYQAPVVYDIEETDDGRFFYSSNYWYGLVEGDGEEIWLKNVEGLSGYAAALQPSGGYVVAGTNARNGEGFALGIDEDGAVQWNTTFPDSGIYAASSAPNGGYTLAGIRFLSPDTSAAWLVNLEGSAAAPTGTPAQGAPGFGAIGAGAALLLLLAGRKWRE